MHTIKLTVELAGTDSISGADVTIALVAADSWQEGIIPSLINDTFSRAQAFGGSAGLEGLCGWDVHMLIGLNADGINPAFMLD